MDGGPDAKYAGFFRTERQFRQHYILARQKSKDLQFPEGKEAKQSENTVLPYLSRYDEKRAQTEDQLDEID